MSFFKELKQRNVFRMALAYVVMTWVLLQVIDVLFEIFSIPGWVARFITILLALGFIPTVLFAWAFEITPEGIKPESQVDRSASNTNATGRKLDLIIIALLIISTAYFFWEARFDSTASVTAAKTQTAAGVNLQSETEALPLTAHESVSESEIEPVSETEDAGEALADASAKSIAVLPFVNMSSDPEQNYFSDGISEELLNVLTKLPNLQVVARTSSFQFKGQNLDIALIAKQLNVNHILEGSVRKGIDSVRVTAQLIQANTGYHLWSENYDRPLEDILAVQDDIAAQIAGALSVQLVLRSGTTYTPKVPKPASLDAYEAFIKGRYLIHSDDPDNLVEAIAELQRALELDPSYAAAHAQLATAKLLNAARNQDGPTTEAAQAEALEHIEYALALDPMEAEAHAAQSLLALQLNDYEAAVAYADEAIRLNSSNTSAPQWRRIALGKTN